MKAKKLQNRQTLLNAGSLSMVYENGSIRWIRLGDTEIVRMIYSAVRDCNWGTIEPIILEEEIRIQDTSFKINLLVEYKAGPIHFEARYHLSGNEKGIRFELNGTALSNFQKNRIGFCILHPIRECAGKTARVNHAGGRVSEFTFPEYISHVQPVKDVRSISWNPVPGTIAILHLSGDVFEMEDQRNWTDASYKTYCTPLELPFPSPIKKGETITQVVELSVEATGINVPFASDMTFSWNQNVQYKLPLLGTAVSSRKEELTARETDLLIKLPLQHLRVEIKINEPNSTCKIHKTIQESEQLGWPLFIVLYLSENYREEYSKFNIICKGLNASIGWLLPIGQNHLSLPVFDKLYPQIKEDFPHVMIGTGVNAYFAELNRTRPSIEKADFISFTISPQVHAFDNMSLVENLQAQADVIRSAKTLFPGKPVFVSPVSLRQRFNIVATTDEPLPLPDQLPSSVDIRQRLNFTAQWTLGSLKYLSQAGAELVSYYETVGWKGWIQGDQAPANQTLFPSCVHEIFPVYLAFMELSGYSTIAHSKSSHPLIFDGLVLYSEVKIKFILFNFTSEDIEIRLEQEVLPVSTLPDSSKGKVFIKANNWVEFEW